MPDWAGDKHKRLAKIQQAMAALEAEARLAAEEERRIEAEKEQQREAEGPQEAGQTGSTAVALNPLNQRNFTDPESRIMKSKDGFVQAYNAQAAVDRRRQSSSRTNSRSAATIRASWCRPVEAIENNLGRKPEQASADFGDRSEANLEALEAYGIDGYVGAGRQGTRQPRTEKVGGPLTQAMRRDRRRRLLNA